MKITVDIDDQLLARVREMAERRGITVDELIRENLESTAGSRMSAEEVVAELRGCGRRVRRARAVNAGRAKSCMAGASFVDTNVLVYAEDNARRHL